MSMEQFAIHSVGAIVRIVEIENRVIVGFMDIVSNYPHNSVEADLFADLRSGALANANFAVDRLSAEVVAVLEVSEFVLPFVFSEVDH
jgi:hypothetical protein